MTESSLELIYAGLINKTIMIEGDCDELSEEQLRDALSFANDKVKLLVEKQLEFQKTVNREKKKILSCYN